MRPFDLRTVWHRGGRRGTRAEGARANFRAEALESRLLLAVDLAGTALNATPEAPVPAGGQTTIHFTVANLGSTAPRAFAVSFYLSADATISAADTLVATFNGTGPAALSSVSDSVVAALPATDPFRNDNQYYLGMIVDPDDVVNESDEANNRNRGDGLDRDAVSSEDHLLSPANGTGVSAFTAPFGTPVNSAIGTDEWIGAYDVDVHRVVIDEGPTTVRFDVDLPGTSALDSYVRLYDAAWTLLDSNNNGFAPGEPPIIGNLASYLSRDLGSGTYYLVVSANGNHTSNPRLLTGRTAASTGAYTLTLTRPAELVAERITVTPDRVAYGGVVSAAYEVANLGDLAAGPFDLQFVLSDDPTAHAADAVLATVRVDGLAGGASATGTVQLSLGETDPFLTDNQYSVIMVVDPANAVAESNEVNNQDRDAVSSEWNLPSPVTGAAVSAVPVLVNSITGGSLLDEWVGRRDTDTFSFVAAVGQQLKIRLDARFFIAMSVYDTAFNRLAATVDPFIDFTAPAAGTYYVVVADDTNHTRDPRALAGRTARDLDDPGYALTVATLRPDLVASLLYFPESNSSVPADGRVNFSVFTVRNTGFAPSPATTVSFYLSDDATVTTTDRFFQSAPIPALDSTGAGSIYQVNLPVFDLPDPDPFPTDNASYVGMVVDPANLIAEISEGNNGRVATYPDVNRQFPQPLRAEHDATSPADGSFFIKNPLDNRFRFPNVPSETGEIGDEWIGPRDIDLFTFFPAAGQTFAFDLDRAPGSALDAHLRLFDAAGNLLAQNDDGAAPGEELGKDPFLVHTFGPVAGTPSYYLVVSAAGNHAAHPGLLTGRVLASTGAYTITMMAADLVGASIATAPVAPAPASGRLTVDYAVRNIGLDAGTSSLTFYLSQDETISPATDLLLAMEALPPLAALATHAASVTLDLPAPDPFRTTNRYWIGMRVDDGGAVFEANESNNLNRGAGLDKLALSSEAHLPSPATGTAAAATAVSVGASTAGDVGGAEWIGAYDLDTYSVDAAAGQRLRFDLDRTGGTLNSFVRLYDAAWGLLNANDDGAAPGEVDSFDSYLAHTFAAAGTYYLVVGALGNNGSDPRALAGRAPGPTAGAYTLDVTDATPRVVGRHAFYNASAFDGRSAAANALDDAAVATDKRPLLPGEAGTFANVTGYHRGINGLMIDVSGGLPQTALAGIAAGIDYKLSPGGAAPWADAPRPSLVGIRPGAGADGSDRITLVWPDGAIRNTWLRVTVRALPQSGLAADDVFTFGNLIGVTGATAAGAPAGGLAVTTADVLATRSHRAAPGVGRGNAYDHNRDGAVNVLDHALTLANLGRSLGRLSPAAALPSDASGAARPPAPPARRPVFIADAVATARLK